LFLPDYSPFPAPRFFRTPSLVARTPSPLFAKGPCSRPQRRFFPDPLSETFSVAVRTSRVHPPFFQETWALGRKFRFWARVFAGTFTSPPSFNSLAARSNLNETSSDRPFLSRLPSLLASLDGSVHKANSGRWCLPQGGRSLHFFATGQYFPPF